jgi:hypothetical protein
VGTIKSRIRNLQLNMDYLEDQLAIVEDLNCSYRRNPNKNEDFRIWYNQYIQKFVGKNVIAFQREMIEISGKISLLSGEDKSTSLYVTEIETLSKMNGNFKKRVDDLIIK